MIIELNESNTNLLNHGQVLLIAKAPWCGPCESMAPMVAQLAEELTGKITVMTLNTDTEHRLASQFNVRGLPTIIHMRDGQRMKTSVGALTKHQLIEQIDSIKGS